jgi:hypothetical protein
LKENKAVLLPPKARELIKNGGHSMNNASAGMRSLCEDVVTGRENRKDCIRQLKEQAQTIRNHARKFLEDSKELHEEMRRTLKKDLQGGRENLIKNVRSLREDFRMKEKDLKKDLTEAGRIWKRMCGNPRNKKARPKSTSERREND